MKKLHAAAVVLALLCAALNLPMLLAQPAIPPAPRLSTSDNGRVIPVQATLEYYPDGNGSYTTNATSAPGVASLSAIATNTAPRSTDYGLLSYRYTTLTNVAQAVKASAGNVFGVRITNTNTNAVFVKFYDVAAGSVTVGTTAVSGTIVVPGGSAAHPAMVWVTPDAVPIFARFTTAIAVAATSNLADADATALGTAIQITVLYL